MASTDIYELRDQIKRLNSQLQSLADEKYDLHKEEQTCEDRLNALRMETSVLSALDEVRFQETKEDTMDGISDSQLLNDKVFLEANLKLELTVFNAEIRQSLPRLEKEAIAWEDSLHKHSDYLAQQEARRNVLPMRSVEAADAKAIELQDERRKIQDQVEKVTRDTALKSKNLKNTLANKRAELIALEDDIEFEKEKSLRLKKTLLGEQAQINYLAEEHSKLQEKLTQFHSGKGWQMEAFLSAAGSQRGTVSADHVMFLLTSWMYPIEDPDGGDAKPDEVINAALDRIQRENDDTLTCDEFIQLCDYLSRPSN